MAAEAEQTRIAAEAAAAAEAARVEAGQFKPKKLNALVSLKRAADAAAAAAAQAEAERLAAGAAAAAAAEAEKRLPLGRCR